MSRLASGHVHDDQAGALQHVGVVKALVAVQAARARLREPVGLAALLALASLARARGRSIAGRRGKTMCHTGLYITWGPALIEDATRNILCHTITGR